MKRKAVALISLVVILILSVVGFVGCGNTVDNRDQDIVAVYNAYVAYADEKGETPLTYEDWLNTIKGEKGDKGDKGQDGLTPTITVSVDGYWVINGQKTNYKANGQDGEDGTDGKSAYEIWLDQGNIGTENDFIDWIKGEKGDDGEDGADGKSAYEIWIDQGNTGSEKDFLDWLKGQNGQDGEDGADGKSAYEIWIDQGNTGSEKDFLNWLKGAEGNSVKKVYIDKDGNLIVMMSDNSVMNAGNVGNFNTGIGISKIEVSKDGKIVVTLSNGINITTGTLANTQLGSLYKSISIDATGKLIVVPSFGTTAISLGKLESAYITSQNEIVLRLDDGNEFNLGKTSTVSGTFCTHVNYSDWIEGERETCTSMGYNVRVCSDCGVLDYEFIPEMGHGWLDVTTIVIPEQNKDGFAFSSCVDCGVSKVLEIKWDGDEDGDKLLNYEEFDCGTNYQLVDTDFDGLTDYEEIYQYGTLPTVYDTDGDGACDGKEVELGFDPLVFNSSFDVIHTYENDDDIVNPTISVELDGDQVDSLQVNVDEFFEDTSMGYMGKAYNYSIDGQLTTTATIGFEFDDTSLDSDALPTIYEFDEKAGTMTPLATTVSGNEATANVNEFSTYVLVDRRIYEESLKWVDVWNTGTTYTSIEIVFVVDDSGSMDWNDGSNMRLSVAKDLIDKLPEGSKMGIVKFESKTTKYTTQLVTNKSTIKNYLTTTYFKSSGSTYMYAAINDSFSLFSTKQADDEIMRMMVVLSDGDAHDTSKHSSTINTANSKSVMVYTVGLGSSTSYFNSYLKPLAQNTGAEYYHSSDASGLADVYNDIRETIDLTTDSDNDGLCDYYEDNMVSFGGITFAPDKTKVDTDGDGLKDGEEIKTVIVYSLDKKQATILGKVYSDPTKLDSDNDGVNDKLDRYPMNSARQ